MVEDFGISKARGEEGGQLDGDAVHITCMVLIHVFSGITQYHLAFLGGERDH